MRTKLFPIDTTMLAWPGWRGALAQRRWAAQYGAEDLASFLKMATERHTAWTLRGCLLQLVRSKREPLDVPHWYVEATCKEHALQVDARGVCPRC